MQTSNAISALLCAHEGETLEFRERFGAGVMETAVAFADTQGGAILVGVRIDAHSTGRGFGKEAVCDRINRIAAAYRVGIARTCARTTLVGSGGTALEVIN